MAGAAALTVLLVVVVMTLRSGARPEEAVAATFVSAMLAGDAEAAYELAAPDYQLLVRPSDLATLAAALREVAGDGARIEIVGSERSGASAPLASLVGYVGRTSVGAVEGVVSLVQLEDDGAWLVRDLSYRFPDASGAELAEVHRVTRSLNEAVADRAEAASTG
ncbi:MAG: hypothetical protein KY461_11695 [Actinobacteria bacterium]|nr:hypothetical protein [Actinomycetota bacterium]